MLTLNSYVLAVMSNLLASSLGSVENRPPTPVPSSSVKKPRLSINLANDMNDDEDTEVVEVVGQTSGTISVSNHSGFVFEWRDVKTKKGKVSAVVTLPSGINPKDVQIKLLPNNQNQLCSDMLSLSFT